MYVHTYIQTYPPPTCAAPHRLGDTQNMLSCTGEIYTYPTYTYRAFYAS